MCRLTQKMVPFPNAPQLLEFIVYTILCSYKGTVKEEKLLILTMLLCLFVFNLLICICITFRSFAARPYSFCRQGMSASPSEAFLLDTVAFAAGGWVWAQLKTAGISSFLLRFRNFIFSLAFLSQGRRQASKQRRRVPWLHRLKGQQNGFLLWCFTSLASWRDCLGECSANAMFPWLPSSWEECGFF